MWHKMLGHCNVDDITKLEHVVQIMKIDDLSKFDCETCTLAKQLNTQNRQPDARGTYPFELVHTNLAGPIDPGLKPNVAKMKIACIWDNLLCLYS